VIEYRNPADTEAPRGEYSHVAVLHGPATGLCFVGGQVGLDERGRVATDLGPQMEQTFENVAAALAAAGASLRSVLQLTTYLTSDTLIPQYFAKRTELFPRLFPDRAYPPNALIVVSALARRPLLIEVQAVAAVPATSAS
jgi:2-iminobutanoate/2-iminopropanoate deaminase